MALGVKVRKIVVKGRDCSVSARARIPMLRKVSPLW